MKGISLILRIFVAAIMLLSAMLIIPDMTTDTEAVSLTDDEFTGGQVSDLDIVGSGEDAYLQPSLANEWLNRAPGNAPPARYGHAMAYDSVNKKTVLFGGCNDTSYFSNTWVYDFSTNQWNEKTPWPKPSERKGHSMVYDSENEVVVLFGGFDGTDELDDTWIYDVSTDTWTEKNPPNSPEARYDHAMTYDSTNNKVMLNGGKANWRTETVLPTKSVGMYSSLALDSNDFPHISFYDDLTHDLLYAKWTGSAWSTQTVDSTGDVGKWTSIDVDSNNYAHISYFDNTNYQLKYARWTGASWNITNATSSWEGGEYISLALDSSDYPHISYCDYMMGNLKYVNWNGTGWTIETVDSNWASYTSITLDSSFNPHISYYDGNSNQLRYAAFNGTEWNLKTVDSDGTHIIRLLWTQATTRISATMMI